jgi:DNA primase
MANVELIRYNLPTRKPKKRYKTLYPFRLRKNPKVESVPPFTMRKRGMK